MPFLTGSPWWLRKLYGNFIWDIPTSEKKLYLSFDDGPHPVATPFVLDTLKKFDAKASFFCIGKNINQHPEIFSRILNEGHAVGNHSFNHLNGWKTADDIYLENIFKAEELIRSNLFRPPYGRIKRSQEIWLKTKRPQMKIIMWTILSGDFDEAIDGGQCFKIVKNKAKEGSIIVFHDSEKAFDRLRYCLPRVLSHFAGLGYRFERLES